MEVICDSTFWYGQIQNNRIKETDKSLAVLTNLQDSFTSLKVLKFPIYYTSYLRETFKPLYNAMKYGEILEFSPEYYIIEKLFPNIQPTIDSLAFVANLRQISEEHVNQVSTLKKQAELQGQCLYHQFRKMSLCNETNKGLNQLILNNPNLSIDDCKDFVLGNLFSMLNTFSKQKLVSGPTLNQTHVNVIKNDIALYVESVARKYYQIAKSSISRKWLTKWKLNDNVDALNLLYVNKDRKYFTNDRDWRESIRQAGMSHYLYN